MPSIFGDSLFNNWMDFPFSDMDKALYGTRTQNVMKTDIRETEKGYELDIDLPGYKKEDVKAQLENGYLTIQAAKTENKDLKDSQGKYIRRERYGGTMSRSFYVGQGPKRTGRQWSRRSILPSKDRRGVYLKKENHPGPGTQWFRGSFAIFSHGFYEVRQKAA